MVSKRVPHCIVKRHFFARHLILQREGIRGGEDHRRNVVLGLLALQLHQAHRVRLVEDLLDHRGTLVGKKKRGNEGEVKHEKTNGLFAATPPSRFDKHIYSKNVSFEFLTESIGRYRLSLGSLSLRDTSGVRVLYSP